MVENKHAILGPSGAHRWWYCPGSIVLEKDEPNFESGYSKEGTLAHTCAAGVLNYCIKKTTFLENVNYKNKEMGTHVNDYTLYVIGELKDGILLVEQELELEWLTGEKGAVGTTDSNIISKDGKILIIIDLKYGMGERVFAFKNPQLIMYGLAALRQFGMLGDFQTIKLVVHQPRLNHVDEWVISVEELLEYEPLIRQYVTNVRAAEKSNSLEGFLNPGEKQCQWCKAKHKCPALAATVVKETGVDFNDLTNAELIEPIDIGRAMAKTDLIELWIKGVRAKTESELFSGKEVKGYKLVEGKRGNREWEDEDKAEVEMKNLQLTKDEMYSSNILTPAKLEKKLKSQPEKWNKLTGLITQKKGKPSVAPVDDPRPALVVDPQADFKNLQEL